MTSLPGVNATRGPSSRALTAGPKDGEPASFRRRRPALRPAGIPTPSPTYDNGDTP